MLACMTRYLSEEDAAADGLRIMHDPERGRFVISQSASSRTNEAGGVDAESAGKVVGFAHYTLLDSPHGAIDFDSTFVDPSFRGTGLSGLLAHRAVTDDIVTGRRVLASCWFIAQYLERHPELTRS